MADLQAGMVLHQRFTITNIIGKGGMATTYAAYDNQLGINIAIKEYFPEMWCYRSPDGKSLFILSEQNNSSYRQGLNCFLSEAKFLSAFSGHPNILTIFDVFEENNTAYYGMEVFRGASLKETLNIGREPMSETEIIAIASEVLNALEYVHMRDSIHRDVNSGNIYLTEKKEVKLIGFGAAINLKKRNHVSLVLNPHYAPPEQYINSGNIGPWTDLYALGAVIYEAVTLRRAPAATERMINDNLIPPLKINSRITKELNAIIIKALALNEKKRFQTASAFREALLKF